MMWREMLGFVVIMVVWFGVGCLYDLYGGAYGEDDSYAIWLAEWTQYGFSEDEAQEWTDAGFEPCQAVTLKDIGCTPETAKRDYFI